MALGKTLPEKHKAYFKTKPEYELLSMAQGDLFQGQGSDFAFMVYDRKNNRISILVYMNRSE